MPQSFDLRARQRDRRQPGRRSARATSASATGASPRSATLARPRRASASTAAACTSCPASSTRQVHFREPGLDHKEDLETGSRAAVLGGVTAVFEMPNTDPLTTSAEALADKLARAKGRMHCDFAFWVGGTHDNVADIPELERLPGAAGIKVFMGSSTGSPAGRRRRGGAGDPQKDPPPRGLPQRGRGAAERAQAPARRRRSVLASGLARRDRGAALDRAAHPPRARGARAGARAAYLDARGDGVSGRRQGRRELRGDAASSDAERRGLCAARARSCR